MEHSAILFVFCDPDNGTIGKKKLSVKDSVKYITPQEISDYYNAGHDVVYYCQRGRRTGEVWMSTKREMEQYLPDAKLHVLTYHRGTQRSYIFVIHPKCYRKLVNILYQFSYSGWGGESNPAFLFWDTDFLFVDSLGMEGFDALDGLLKEHGLDYGFSQVDENTQMLTGSMQFGFDEE